MMDFDKVERKEIQDFDDPRGFFVHWGDYELLLSAYKAIRRALENAIRAECEESRARFSMDMVEYELSLAKSQINYEARTELAQEAPQTHITDVTINNKDACMQADCSCGWKVRFAPNSVRSQVLAEEAAVDHKRRAQEAMQGRAE